MTDDKVVQLNTCELEDTSEEICNKLIGKPFVVAYIEDDHWRVSWNMMSRAEVCLAANMVIQYVMNQAGVME